MKMIYIWGESQCYQNYQRAIEAAGWKVQFCGDPSGCAGLLLPGGGDLEPWRYGQVNIASSGLEPERDEAELRLLEYFSARKLPILGICRGLQIINVYFGGTLAQDISGHNVVNGMDRYHKVRTAPSVLTGLYGNESIVNSAHHQAVDRLGGGLDAVQWAPDGAVEAVCHRSLPIFAVQWHPERLFQKLNGEKVFHLFLSLCKTGKFS